MCLTFLKINQPFSYQVRNYLIIQIDWMKNIHGTKIHKDVLQREKNDKDIAATLKAKKLYKSCINEGKNVTYLLY